MDHIEELCQSCSGPLKDFAETEIEKHPGFCPNCVDEQGSLRSFKEILEGMIEYIESDHPEIAKDKQESQAVEWLQEGPIWSEKFVGYVIEESLSDRKLLEMVKVTNLEAATNLDPETHNGFDTWHIYKVEFYKTDLDKVLDLAKETIKENWFTDFRGTKDHFVIFKDNVFKAKANDKASYEEAINYGENQGIERSQLNGLFEVSY